MRNTDSKITETFANNEYISLNTEQEPKFYNEKLQENERVFTYERYFEEVHPPVEIPLGKIDFPYNEQCLDMPIRLAGESEYKLPTQWKSLQKTLEQLISVEHSHNPSWKDYYTYITVDNRPVKVGEQQRHGGLHVDGFQGTRINPKTKITRNYVATTNGGTQFWNQPFVVADPAEFNVFKGFDLQIDGNPFVAKPNTFYFMDAYTVHESGFAEFDGDRIFIRLTYDLKKFDRLGNTHNPNLDYDWEMVERTTQQTVRNPKLTDIIASPYFPTLKNNN